MDPYNNDPFAVDDSDITNERDANRALADTVGRTPEETIADDLIATLELIATGN